MYLDRNKRHWGIGIIKSKKATKKEKKNARENQTTVTTITAVVDNRWADREFEVFRSDGGK